MINFILACLIYMVEIDNKWIIITIFRLTDLTYIGILFKDTL